MYQVDAPTATQRWTDAGRALRLGALLQVVCIALPVFDLWIFGTIERHVQGAYPQWGPETVALDRNAIAGYLVIVGVLGLAGWLLAVRAQKRGVRARAVVTTLFVVGMSLLMLQVDYGGEAYDHIIPLWLSMATLCILAVPGVAAVIAVWRPRA